MTSPAKDLSRGDGKHQLRSSKSETPKSPGQEVGEKQEHKPSPGKLRVAWATVRSRQPGKFSESLYQKENERNLSGRELA